jgi:hypothetical protein
MMREPDESGRRPLRADATCSASEVPAERRFLGWLATALGAALMLAGGAIFLISVP